jgi:hypothetical protein
MLARLAIFIGYSDFMDKLSRVGFPNLCISLVLLQNQAVHDCCGRMEAGCEGEDILNTEESLCVG